MVSQLVALLVGMNKKFISHIKYEKEKGANFYVAKYLDKEIEYNYIWKN